MDEHSVLRLLGQVSCEISGEVIREFLRGAVRKMLCEVMALEVSELCDKKHQPDGNSVFRAGSSVGTKRFTRSGSALTFDIVSLRFCLRFFQIHRSQFEDLGSRLRFNTGRACALSRPRLSHSPRI